MNNNSCLSFRYPPVVETALSVQFDELTNFRTTHFGKYHTSISDRFPVTQDKNRLEPVREFFPIGLRPQLPPLHFAKAALGEPQRVWYQEAVNEGVMLQLQPDRFIFNWRKKENEAYPRYETNKPRLLEEYERFCTFVRDEQLGEVQPNLCEVTYVNHVLPDTSELPTECMASIFTGLDWISSDGWLNQPPAVVTFNRVFEIDNQKGRLYIETSIANSETKGDFILLKITARVNHKEEDDLTANLDLAHEWVVKSFVSVTDRQVRHERWGELP